MTTRLTEVQYIALAQIAYGSFGASFHDAMISVLLSQHIVEGETEGAFRGVGGIDEYRLLSATSLSSGFSGQVYRPPNGSSYADELVFTFSGTNSMEKGDIYGFLQDLDDNGFISTGTAIPTQFLDAYAFVKSTIEIKVGNPMTDAEIASYVQANNITFTGHSLGGGIAQYLTYRTGGAAVTFNAVGIGQITGLNIDPQNYASYNVKNYVSSDDIVGNFGSHLGEVQYLAGVLSNTNVDIDAVSKVIRITLAMLTNNHNHRPFALSPSDRSVDTVFRPVIGGYQLARNPLRIDDNQTAFVTRWVKYLVDAVENTYVRPSNMPEEKITQSPRR